MDYFENTPSVAEYDFEKVSYSKTAYKRVQRLRRKGRRRGIDVPYLNYELHKPEKPRTIFWIAAIISAVLLLGIFVGIGFLYNEIIKSISIFNDLGEALTALFDPETFMASAGLSAIPGMMIFLACLLLIVAIILPLCAAIYFYRFVRDVFYMANCSKEEFAKGNIISSRIFGLITVLAVAAVIFIVILIFTDTSAPKVISGLVFGGIVLVVGGLLALIIMEKTKSKKWFDTLDESNKQNYLEHEQTLRRVKRRLNNEKQFWSNLGK